jgi:hypothetical protein
MVASISRSRYHGILFKRYLLEMRREQCEVFRRQCSQETITDAGRTLYQLNYRWSSTARWNSRDIASRFTYGCRRSACLTCRHSLHRQYDAEEGSTVRADAAMAVMLGLRLPEVIFGREWKLLRRWRDIGLGVRYR